MSRLTPTTRYDLIDADVDLDDEADVQRYRDRIDRFGDIEDAYKTISQALNRGDENMVLGVLMSEHSTLLGKLANVVLAAAGERDHDGRLTLLNMTLGDILHKTGYDEHTRVTDLRQPLI